LSLEKYNRGADLVEPREGNIDDVVTLDVAGPPGSKNTACSEGSPQEPGRSRRLHE
jgi:hypothetical protein